MSVSYDLSGRTAVVTGAAQGIGRAIAEHLRDAGARVIAWDRQCVDVPGVTAIEVDISRADEIGRAVAQTVSSTARVDILVNNAGHLGPLAPLGELAWDDALRVIAVNLVGTMDVCRQLLPLLRHGSHSRIVNMGSLAGKEGLRNLPAYSAASGGVIAFTKALAKELADTGIRVNCVAPGPIHTEMITALGPEVVAAMIATSPMKRLGTAGEVAALVLWLCSDACSFNTGAVFDMSGGRAGY